MKKTWRPLYKKSMSGDVLKWSITAQTEVVGSSVITNSGRLGGRFVSTTIPITTGKNTGKANSTTSYEQAVKEAAAKYKKKYNDGYRTLEEICISNNLEVRDDESVLMTKHLDFGTILDSNDVRKPMKAQPYKAGKINYPAYVQPKLNGVRCTVQRELITEGVGLFAEERRCMVLRSKEGNRYHLPHIEDELERFRFVVNKYKLVLDGELYMHGEPLNLIRQRIPIEINGTVSKPSLNSSEIEYWIFDLSIEGYTQQERLVILNELLSSIDHDLRHIKFVSTIEVYNDDQAIQEANNYIKHGFEGCIVRDKYAEYAFGKRPKTMMKIKQAKDAEFKIIDIIKKNYDSSKDRTFISFLLKNDINDETFESTPLGDESERLEYLNNKEQYIGKLATVKYYERTSDKELPFHTNVITVRDYE